MDKFKTQYIYVPLAFLFISCIISCTNKNDINSDVAKIETKNSLQNTLFGDFSTITDTIDYENATYFIVIADTSQYYSTLQKRMFDLNRNLKIPIDTMGRFYDKSKNLIALPDNDEDEIYAGSYYPRRYPSENLSLEYLNFYQEKAGEKTIALVTGIYETEKKADSALMVLNQVSKNGFKIKADIYIGCMH